MSLMSFEMKSFGASAPFLAWPILYAGSVTKRPLRCSPIDDPYPKKMRRHANHERRRQIRAGSHGATGSLGAAFAAHRRLTSGPF